MGLKWGWNLNVDYEPDCLFSFCGSLVYYSSTLLCFPFFYCSSWFLTCLLEFWYKAWFWSWAPGCVLAPGCFPYLGIFNSAWLSISETDLLCSRGHPLVLSPSLTSSPWPWVFPGPDGFLRSQAWWPPIPFRDGTQLLYNWCLTPLASLRLFSLSEVEVLD